MYTIQPLSSQPDWEDEDIGSVQQEDFFNLRHLFVAMKTNSDKDGKIGITKNRPIETLYL